MSLSTSLLAATLACVPLHATTWSSPSSGTPLATLDFSHFEAPLSSAASAAAFANTARNESTALFAIAPEEMSSSVSAPSGAAPESALPDAPMPVAVPSSAFMFQASNTGTAKKYAIVIPSGWSAQPLSAGDKVILGIRNLANVESLAGTVISAGYAHLVNGQPNYGTDGTAFGKRFGAGVARSASQNIFTNSVLAPILHEDPRYYVEGSNYGFFHRVLYAATRPIITRTDSGHSTVNASMLIGYAGAAALTPTYYPQINHNFHDIAETYGASLGGAALGFGVSEFSDQLLKAIHLKH